MDMVQTILVASTDLVLQTYMENQMEYLMELLIQVLTYQMLYVKDLLPHIDEKDFAWQQLLRPAFFVPENKKINDLFQDFRTKKIHIAIVVDEYGGTSGLVTLEDIVEEIVGDISDEFDKEPENDNYKKIDNETYIFKAQISIVDFCKVFSIDDDYFEEIEGESDTLAGIILEMEGRIPEKGFKSSYKEFTFEIVESDNKHIIKIKIIIKQITVEDVKKADQLFEDLMGAGITPRKKYIQDHSAEATGNV